MILFRFVFVIEYSHIFFSFLLCLFSIRLKRLGKCVVDAFEDELIEECVVGDFVFELVDCLLGDDCERA